MIAAKYVGSKVCSECHSDVYAQFRSSGHPYKLSKAKDAKKRKLPLPSGYSWKDISYVIGGAYKKVRYIDKKGYIITSAKDGSDLRTQYNLETQSWVYYHRGEKKPYDCGRCHTTGFKATGNQDGLEGIKGTWAWPGIQCEACHGAGSDHAKTADTRLIKIDRSAALCGKCHVRGQASTIPAKGGFIRHHEQLNEMLASPHNKISCVGCHNPHKRAQSSIKKKCETCHANQALAYNGSSMQKTGVLCVDCHMPRITKSAVATSKFEGDIRTHLFSINTDINAHMFYRGKGDGKGKGKEFANRLITLDFACLGCHKTNSRKWAASYIKNIHSLGK